MKKMHVMTLRIPKELHAEALRVADGRSMNPWIRRLIEAAHPSRDFQRIVVPDDGSHHATLRVPQPLYARTSRVVGPRAYNSWICSLIEAAVRSAQGVRS